MLMQYGRKMTRGTRPSPGRMPIAPLLSGGLGLASHIGPSEATIRRGLWRKQVHSGAMPTGPRKARPDDRLRIEPGIQGFPDVRLHICGLVLTHHPGMTASDLFAAVRRGLRDFTRCDIALLHRRGIGKPRLRG